MCSVFLPKLTRLCAAGYMVTSLTRTILDNNPDLEATWTSLTPMGRLGVPEDLKGAIVFLASDASAFVTGTEVKVDGGYWCVLCLFPGIVSCPS